MSPITTRTISTPTQTPALKMSPISSHPAEDRETNTSSAINWYRLSNCAVMQKSSRADFCKTKAARSGYCLELPWDARPMEATDA